MNLLELKQIVQTWTDANFVFSDSFNRPHSYRGYYDHLSFEISTSNSVADIHVNIREAYEQTFVGWKGGDYTYDDTTPVHLSYVGSSSDEYGLDFETLVHCMDAEYKAANHTQQAPKRPRKTAAQKRAEAEAAHLAIQQAFDTNFRTEYHTRLLHLVHCYLTELPMHVKVSTNSERIFEFANSNYSEVRLPIFLTDDWNVSHVADSVEDVERFLLIKQEELRLAKERADKKSAALAKLTKEERELLGL